MPGSCRLKTYREIQKKNMEFHCAVVGLARNQWLDKAHGLLMDHYASLHFRYVIKQKGYEDARQIHEDHRLVVDALDKGDIEGSKRIIKIHMQRVKDQIEKELFQMNSGGEVGDGLS